MKKISLYSVGAVFALLMVLFACTSEDDSSALMGSLSKEKTEKKSTDLPDSLQADNALSPDSSANPYALSEEEKNGLLAYAKSKDITIVLDDNPSGPVDVAAIKQLIDGLAKPFKIVAIDSIPVTGRFPRLRSSAENDLIHFSASPSSGTKTIKAEKIFSYTMKEFVDGKLTDVRKDIEYLATAIVSWSKQTEESEGNSRAEFDAYCINGTTGYDVFCTPGTSSESFTTNGKEDSDYQVLSVSVYADCTVDFTAKMPGIKSVSTTIAVSLTVDGSQGTASIS